MGELLLASVCCGLGACLRFGQDGLVTKACERFQLAIPVGTMAVNVTACLLVGLFAGLSSHVMGVALLKPYISSGFLGGYSTFSTASIEGARLLQEGKVKEAVAHSSLMFILSLLAVGLGFLIGA